MPRKKEVFHALDIGVISRGKQNTRTLTYRHRMVIGAENRPHWELCGRKRLCKACNRQMSRLLRENFLLYGGFVWQKAGEAWEGIDRLTTASAMTTAMPTYSMSPYPPRPPPPLRSALPSSLPASRRPLPPPRLPHLVFQQLAGVLVVSQDL